MARNAESAPEAADLGIPQQDPNVTIDLDEEEEGGDEPESRAAGGGEGDEPRAERSRDPKTGKWTDKKRERGKERREFDEWRKNRPNYEAQMRQIREDSARQLRDMQMRLDNALRQPAPQQQQQAADPYAGQIADLKSQMDAELRLIEADPKRDYSRYMDLQDKRNEVIAMRAWARQDAQRQRQQPQQPQRTPYAGREPIIEAEYPWTMDPTKGELTKRAAAYKQYLVSVEGRPDTLDTDREALTTIASRFGAQYGVQAPAAAPTARTRELYAVPGQRTAPRRGPGGGGEITIPRALANGTGLSPGALARALRED